MKWLSCPNEEINNGVQVVNKIGIFAPRGSLRDQICDSCAQLYLVYRGIIIVLNQVGLKD